MRRTTRVTIMFTDLVGSTELLDQLGDHATADLIGRHFAMLRRAVATTGGREIKSLGDGLMIAFASPSAATACAAAMQRATVRHNLQAGNVQLGLRIGIHHGQVLHQACGDLLGMPVVIAKRLCDLCDAGQVIVSHAAREHSEQNFVELGQLALKGVSAAVAAAALQWQPADPALPALVAV
ncbi:adenylate/guanylate cyclase domain-containing protein [Jatrophihabitans sp.]|uniref:adenylate/guanylate cyclase domain-containing protein n=1 Tax=Jatrophihabitans sp. TaxID=1932789 RepID=UPI0030C7825F|nr:cyclase [Jatrophihabitans sp.]